MKSDEHSSTHTVACEPHWSRSKTWTEAGTVHSAPPQHSRTHKIAAVSEPTGEIATGINPRGFGEPVLRLDGRRSILALWPQDAVGEVCAAGPERTGGYVGPVQGDAAIFPNATLRYICKACARAKAGLYELELTGHVCSYWSSATCHVDRRAYSPGELEELSPRDRIDYVTEQDQYSKRGWTVLAVEPATDWPPQQAIHTGTSRSAPRATYRASTRSTSPTNHTLRPQQTEAYPERPWSFSQILITRATHRPGPRTQLRVSAVIQSGRLTAKLAVLASTSANLVVWVGALEVLGGCAGGSGYWALL